MLKKGFGFVAVMTLLVLPRMAWAQYPPGGPGPYGPGHDSGDHTLTLNLGKKPPIYKGWYLYWPVEALKQPRLPMPYPWWPQQSAALAAPAPALTPTPPGPLFPPTNNPPSPAPIHLPNDTQRLPALPGVSSWGTPYNPDPVAPVGYSAPAPSYWYGR
jgi:hypothetical protein